MIHNWLARQAFDALWPLVWHFGILGAIGTCAGLWAWFVPVFKKTAAWVALSAFIMLVTAGIYTNLGAEYVQAKWNAAATADADAARKAREKAEAATPAVVPGTPHAKRLRHDKYDRDNGK